MEDSQIEPENIIAKNLYCVSSLKIKKTPELMFEEALPICNGKWEVIERNNSLIMQLVGSEGVSDWWVECNGVSTDSGMIISSSGEFHKASLDKVKNGSLYEVHNDQIYVNFQTKSNTLLSVDYHFKGIGNKKQLVRILIQEAVTDNDSYGVPVYTKSYLDSQKVTREEKKRWENEKYGVRPLFQHRCCDEKWTSIHSIFKCNICGDEIKGKQIKVKRACQS